MTNRWLGIPDQLPRIPSSSTTDKNMTVTDSGTIC